MAGLTVPSGGGNTESSGQDLQADFRQDMADLDDAPSQMGEDAPLDAPSRPTTPKPPKPPVEGEEEEGDGEDIDEEEEGDEGQDGEEGEDEEVEGEEPEPEPLSSGMPRPSYKDIKTKYPNFFKEFPDMRHMMFREEKYTELFPTVEDAQQARDSAGDFNSFQTLLQTGKPDDFVEFLDGIKKGGPTFLTNMASNFLPGLFKADQDMYYAVTTPIAESMVRSAYKAAVNGNDENLKNAALHVAKWAFGDVAFATGEKQTPMLKATEAEKPKDEKYETEKKNFYTERYNEARSYVSDTAKSRLQKEIIKGLDPNNAMRAFTRAAAVEKIFARLGEAMDKDQRHMAQMNSLWAQGHKAGFVGNWKDRLLTTYLSRARALMPAIRTQVRSEAVGDDEQHLETRAERAGKSQERKEVSGSGNQTGRRGPQIVDAKTIDWNQTSDMDILNDKPKLRK